MMNASHMSRSSIKDYEKTNLSINKQSLILKHPKKSKSQINITKKSHLKHLNQQLESLKSKIEASKGILSTIYSKVKNKESQYEQQISHKDLHLHRAKLMINDYKNLYQNGLKDMETFVDKTRTVALQRNQQHLSKAKLQELKKNALQKLKGKESLQNQLHYLDQPKTQFQRNFPNSKQNESVFHKKIEPTPMHKMKKSHSAIDSKKTKYQFQKIPVSKESIANKQKSITNKQKQKKQRVLEKQKQKQLRKDVPKLTQSKLTHFYIPAQGTDSKKSLYEIYKQRILKRQKQQNSQKMNWIVEKLQQNINDLQLIRKKSEMKLKKYSPQSLNHSQMKISKVQNAESFDRKERPSKVKNSKLQQEIKRQRSKEKYLEIQKSKLKKINEYIPK